MAQNARITTTISGVVTDADLEVRLNAMEERIMSALTEAVATLRQAVNDAAGRLGDPGAVEAAVAAERARYDALVSAEASEDLAQDAELQAARAEVDRLIAEQTAAAGELVTLADQLNSVGTAVDEAPPGTPVDEVEVPPVDVPSPGEPVEPSPVPEEPTPDAPADEPAPVTPDVPADEAPADDTVDPDVPPVPPADGGPTDADGNPVDSPAV